MRKILGLCLIVIAAASLLIGCDKKETSNSEAKSENSIVMKLANASPVGDPRDAAAVRFAELVEERTDGRVKIEVYSGATLGDWRDTIEGLKPGIVQVVVESLGTIEPYTKLAAIDAVPFLYRDDEHFQKVWSSAYGESLLEMIGVLGDFELMGPMYRGARYVTSTKAIHNAEDIVGLKIRVPNIQIYMKTWEMLDAAATPMAFTEVYTGLQQGTVEAQENPLTIASSAAFYEVCPYLIETKHVYSTDLFIFDKTFFSGLPADMQEIIKDSARVAADERTKFVQENEASIIKDFEEKGVTFIKPDLVGIRSKVKEIINDFPDIRDLASVIESM